MLISDWLALAVAVLVSAGIIWSVIHSIKLAKEFASDPYNEWQSHLYYGKAVLGLVIMIAIIVITIVWLLVEH